MNRDLVMAGLQILEEEVAGGVGGGLAIGAFVKGVKLDGGTLDNGSGDVGDGAADAAEGGLGARGPGVKDEQHDGHYDRNPDPGGHVGRRGFRNRRLLRLQERE